MSEQPEKNKEGESFYSDEEYMAKVFEKDNREIEHTAEKDPVTVPRKRSGALLWVTVSVLVLALGVFLFFALRKDETVGAGNFAMESKIVTVGHQTFYAEPTQGALCMMTTDHINTASLAAKKNVRFLTNIEGKLYYLDADSYTFRQYTDGAADKQVLDSACYYPSYYQGCLYYIDANDYLIYRAKMTGGRFDAPEALISGTRACFLLPYENKLFFVSYDDNRLYACPIEGQRDPIPLSEHSVDSYIGAAKGWLYYTELQNNASDELTTAVLYRMATGNTQKKEALFEGMCAYINYYRGFIYFLQYRKTDSDSPEAEYIYRIPVAGGEPEQISLEAGYDLHLIGNSLYYVSAGNAGDATWKRIKLSGETVFPAVGEPIPSSSLVNGQDKQANTPMSGYTFGDDGTLVEVEDADIRYEADGSVSIGNESDASETE